VTRDLNLYIWGQGAPTGTAVDYISNLILETDPTPINLDYDIIDVACGKNCLLALTKDRRLFVIGSNRNGQLGLGDVKSVDQWTEVLLPVKEDAMIMSVHTGYKNSFVVVKNGKAKGDKKRKRETSTEISNKNSRTAEG
jgi:alpha-tubulin suppressor-like RCC1 family protein